MHKESYAEVVEDIKGKIAQFVKAERERKLKEADVAIARAVAANKVAVEARASVYSAQPTDAAYSEHQARIAARLACDECLVASRAFFSAVHGLAVEKKVVAALAALEVGEQL